MPRIILCIGLALFLPGLASLGYSLWQGPAAWSTDAHSFWGLPIALFVFWIGLAHAGTLLSAIFLALGIRLDRRTAALAELSTLCCLAVAAVFPLMHLGIVENFYMVIPFADARENFANVRSPLVWDFCCIAVYGILSLVFFCTHVKGGRFPSLMKLRKPMAWLLFPMVLWVHTVVSLDFACALIPEWRGAFFPVYFIVGAIYSGLALVNGILCTEGYRVRLLERLMFSSSWMLLVIWLWDFMVKGNFSMSAFILAGVIPQLLLVERIRDNRISRGLVCLSILLGLFAERFDLVMPVFSSQNGCSMGIVDYGLIAFGVGAFVLMFTIVRHLLAMNIAGEGTYFGEVDGRDMAMNETSPEEIALDKIYKAPWTTEEFCTLRMPLLWGHLAVVLFAVWSLNHETLESVDVSLVNIFPVTYPLMALVASSVLYLNFLRVNVHFAKLGKFTRTLIILLTLSVALIAGMLYAGGSSAPAASEIGSIQTGAKSSSPVLMWNSRCATCHGTDGMFNNKFVREFYPVPQKLSAERIDSLGTDSLMKVILNGRGNMNAYGSRLTETEARALVEYMRSLSDLISQEAQ